MQEEKGEAAALGRKRGCEGDEGGGEREEGDGSLALGLTGAWSRRGDRAQGRKIVREMGITRIGRALPGSGRARGGGQGMRGREIDGESRGLGLEGLGGPWEAGPVEKEVARGLAGQLGWALFLSLISIRKEIERGKEREG